MKTPPVGLLAALLSEYIGPEQWIAWADDQITRTEKPPMWIIDLSLAADHSQAMSVIRISLETDLELSINDLDDAALAKRSINDLDDDALGLIALRYFEGKLGFGNFLRRAGLHSDGRSCSTDCEYFYEHLNLYEAATNPSAYEARAAVEIRAYLKEALELASVARSQIRTLGIIS